MDPALEELLVHVDGEEEIEAITKLRDVDIAPEDMRVVARFGNIATCRLLNKDIRKVWASEATLSLKAPRQMSVDPDPEAANPSSQMDESVESIQQTERIPRLPFKGKGVVVGIVDWGFDFTHPNFLDANGNTRFDAIWDQSASYDQQNKYGYGRVYTRSEINLALKSRKPFHTLGYHPSKGIRSNGMHGTHVLDIAAGSGRVGVSGVAPHARLIAVHLSSKRRSPLASLGDSVRILEAIDFIAKKTDNRPLVINMSVGKHGGSHRGNSLVEQGIDAFLKAKKGRAVVQSTGNYFLANVHVSGRLQPGEKKSFNWKVNRFDRTANELEIWYSYRDNFNVQLTAPDGTRIKAPLGQQKNIVINGERVGRLYHRANEPNTGDHHIDIFLYKKAPTGKWNVELEGKAVVDGRYHGWIERDGNGKNQSRFDRNDVSPFHTTGTICNGLYNIAVGAYDSHTEEFKMAPFSSSGPTTDGRQKPNVLAPGYRIQAARSADVDDDRSDGKLTVKSGTSMAAPFVTGTVALLFEAVARPLTVEETRNFIISSTQKVAGESFDQHRVGNGIVDVEKLLQHVHDRKTFASQSEAKDSNLLTTEEVINHLQQIENLESDFDQGQIPDEMVSRLKPFGSEQANLLKRSARRNKKWGSDLNFNLIPGLSLVPGKGSHLNRLKVDLTNFFYSDIGDIGRFLGLEKKTVLKTVLSNKIQVKHLWSDQEIEPNYVDTKYPGFWKARKDLLGVIETVRTTRLGYGGRLYPSYYKWTLKAEGSIVLPLTKSAYLKLKKEIAAEDKRRRKEIFLKDVKQPFEAFFEELRKLAKNIKYAQADIQEETEKYNKQIGLCLVMDELLDVALKYPNSASLKRGSVRRGRMEILQRKVRSFKAILEDNLIRRPAAGVGDKLIYSKGRRDTTAKNLITFLESEAMHDVVDYIILNWDVLPISFKRNFYYIISTCFAALQQTPQADRVMKKHLLPFIQKSAEGQIKIPADFKFTNKNLEKAIKKTVPSSQFVSSSDSILVKLAPLDRTIFSQRMEPLFFSIVRQSGPQLMQYSFSKDRTTHKLAAMLYKATAQVARLDMVQSGMMLGAMDTGNLSMVKSMKIQTYFAGSILIIASMASFMSAMQSDTMGTLNKWIDISRSLGNAGFGTMQMINRFKKITEMGKLGKSVFVIVGAIGGAASVVLGAKTYVEERREGDMQGQILALADMTSGLSTIAAVIITASIGTGPLAIGVAALGVVLAIGAAIWRWFSDDEPNTEAMFKGILKKLGDDPVFKKLKRARPIVGRAYERVKYHSNRVQFWTIANNPQAVYQLKDVGFSNEQIAQLIDKDEYDVQNHLWNKQEAILSP